jgi:hypothetical protein
MIGAMQLHPLADMDVFRVWFMTPYQVVRKEGQCGKKLPLPNLFLFQFNSIPFNSFGSTNKLNWRFLTLTEGLVCSRTTKAYNGDTFIIIIIIIIILQFHPPPLLG